MHFGSPNLQENLNYIIAEVRSMTSGLIISKTNRVTPPHLLHRIYMGEFILSF